MELKSIINFDDALLALRNELCEDIYPFIISTNGIQKYNSMKHKLSTYLQEPNQSEIQQLFQKCDVWQMFQEGEISEREALEVLLRLHNFHLLEKFHFQTNPTIVRILHKFLNTFLRNLMVTNYSLESLSLKYFKFTTSLSLQPPVLNRAISESGQVINREISNNGLKKKNGLFYPKPDDWHQLFKIKNINNFKVSKSRLLSIDDIYTDFIFELTYSDESLIQQAVCFNYFRPVTKLISSLFDKACVLPKIREVKLMADEKVSVTAKMEIMLNDMKIPIDVESKNVSRLIKEFTNSSSNISETSFPFIKIFSQCVKQAFVVGTPYVILTDYDSLILIDLLDNDISDDFEDDSFGYLTRGLKCRILFFEDSCNDPYSFYAKFFMFLIDSVSTQPLHDSIMKRFDNKSMTNKSLRNILVNRYYNRLHICNSQLFKSDNS
ncbi:uncharacterized protein RJT21DRAFT_119294 [Scheffersomyces amazonensis]|uniref:uncharacterized protein n=1 Tax=Scheffersomyces amazonensis TaxID=1078765 RepID=UPI00315C7FEC